MMETQLVKLRLGRRVTLNRNELLEATQWVDRDDDLAEIARAILETRAVSGHKNLINRVLWWALLRGAIDGDEAVVALHMVPWTRENFHGHAAESDEDHGVFAAVVDAAFRALFYAYMGPNYAIKEKGVDAVKALLASPYTKEVHVAKFLSVVPNRYRALAVHSPAFTPKVSQEFGGAWTSRGMVGIGNTQIVGLCPNKGTVKYILSAHPTEENCVAALQNTVLGQDYLSVVRYVCSLIRSSLRWGYEGPTLQQGGQLWDEIRELACDYDFVARLCVEWGNWVAQEV